ncbi:MAG: hypothetical protein HPY85_01600 [Anaerolineae bacterium]|nr:hypothetical protein [Anaerolineae bacterium]
MDHVVYVDAKANELEKLLSGEKTMIIRGAAGRKLPHGRVNTGDRLFLIQNNGEGLVRASALVKQAYHSEKLSPEESNTLVQQNQVALQLTPAQAQRWSGKRYLVLIEVTEAASCEPFSIDRSAYGNMDDWLPVGDIDTVKCH